MAIVSLKSFDEFLQDLIYIVRASTDKITDFNVGSVTRAYLDALSMVQLYSSSKIETIESAFYLLTATNTNLDNKLGDYDLTRKIGEKATGNLYFVSNTPPTNPITIPAGTPINTQKDGDGNYLQYLTTEDGILSATSVVVGSDYPYTVSIPAKCVVSGIIGNVSARQVTEVTQDIAGVLAVYNPLPMTGGTESETDEQFRSRGKLYLQSLSKGTKNALKSTILGISGINNVEILDWNDVDPLSIGAIAPGIMKIILDTDNNTIASTPITIGGNTITYQIQIDVWNTIKDAVKAAGVGVVFEQTTLVPVNIEVTVDLNPDNDLKTIPTVSQATFNSIFKARVQTYFNNILVNEDVKWSKILQNGINITGVNSMSNIILYTSTFNNPAHAPYLDVVLNGSTGHFKGILNSIKVNGVLI